MNVDTVQLYGPGLSFYLAHAKPSTGMDAPAGLPNISLRRYSAALKALHASNEQLEGKAKQLNNNIIQLKLDVMEIQHDIKAFHGELLATWQADILTRLIEVVYERSGWKLPGGITTSSHEGMDEAKVTLMYRTAVRKIKKETLRERFGLSVRYYLALQKYDEVVCFRSTNPVHSEYTFARWLMSPKENCARIGLFNFWGRLFPLCYGRTVQETSQMF
ncbi:hypothetical protein BDV26DRAFT_298830 [Aspergillus bertholletiae]|uniref:Uncharacterized protein n=1 Tax=Aspergillus bertholletiae TaxID=1226010 RepID=A0A5N7ANG5_9EURO|nr:hypothetical protein BDV26DRAFT_298830 [Aspergillus bertholletiae]